MKTEILKYIAAFKKEKGYAPAQSDIAAALGTTRQNVNYHFYRMEKELKKYQEYKKLFDKVKD